MAYNMSCYMLIFPLQCDSREITWEHLEKLYLDETKSYGKRPVPKLKYEHVYLTTFSKMRVDLAAEVRLYGCYMIKLVFLHYKPGP